MGGLILMPLKKSSGFSIEIKSRKHIKTMNLSNGHPDAVLIEGDLGLITEVSMFEDKVLVVKGRHGTIRVELSRMDLCFSQNDLSPPHGSAAPYRRPSTT
jgi:hypothetical protein